MGEMADFYIEQELTANPHWSLVGGRRRAKSYRQNFVHVCKLCGKTGLAWVPAGDTFTLVTSDRKPHQCSESTRMQHAAADFKDPDQ